MNATLLFSTFRKLFPSGTELIVVNLVDKKTVLTINGNLEANDNTDSDLTHIALLKDYFGIKGQILSVKIDLINGQMEVHHTNGVKMINETEK